MRTLMKDVLSEPVRPYAYATGHKQHVGHRSIGKFKIGPGGMDCPCCTMWHPTKLKVKFHRYERRKAKQQLKLNNEE